MIATRYTNEIADRNKEEDKRLRDKMKIHRSCFCKTTQVNC